MSPSKRDVEHKEEQYERYQEAKMVRRIVVAVISVLIIVFSAAGISGYLYVKSALEPADPDAETSKEVEIPLGSSVSAIAQILEENGIIKNSTIFRFYVKFKNESGFQAGDYTFSPSMTLEEIVAALKTGKIIREPVLTVTIPEGKTMNEIANIFSHHSNFTKEEFLEKVNDMEYIEQLIDRYPTILSDEILDTQIRTPLEGYLFAATYEFYEENPTVEEIVDKMLTKTEDVILPYLNEIDQLGLTVHEAITMASLVENEARLFEDRQLIAGVFYNRLEKGMPLQTDPTVLYALGEHKDRVLFEDLEVDSPYNTYKYPGLPIGPISNFAENSLQAIAQPAETDYLYFVASYEGDIYYSKTYEEHLQLIEKYRN
ncbi:MAG: endolytic transglycosylase MltG [Bacillaceae bacterium]|nr:endolytic transglycosylase MltG [Bacillaceae bacterium]